MSFIKKIESSKELNIHMPRLTELLSRSFYNDPYYVHIMSDDNKRMSQIQWWQRILLRYTLRNGDIFVTEDFKGVAMSIGPDKPFINDFQMALLGLLFFPVKVSFRNFMRLLSVNAQWTTEHKKQSKRHYYLMVIGVDPEFQNTGIGNELMQKILKKADEDQLDCFLETVTFENVQFYRKLNFEVICNKEFGLNSQYWLMKRTPY